MTYAWTASSSVQSSDLVNYIEKQTSSSIAVTKLLFPSNIDFSLVVTLKVTNVFGGTNSISITTAIQAATALEVVFESGTTDTITSSDSRTYKASVSQFCDSSVSSLSWKWSYIALSEAPTVDSSSILSASNQPNKLIINKNMLPSGYSYQFNATAASQSSFSQVSVSGYSILTIKVTSSPLKIKLSKSSCTLSSQDGFSINGDGSYDPDNSTTVLSYKWSCLYTANATSCLGTNNEDLVSSASSSNLSIPSDKMIPEASYSLTLVISSGTRTASASITVEVTAAKVSSSSSVEIPYSESKISAGSYYVLSATSNISPGSKIKWTCDSSSIKISPDDLPIISIPPDNFIPGSSYKFSFTITESSGNTLSSSIIVNVNKGATCDGSLDIQPTSGTALETTFVISIDGCYDQDGQDYPITYAYDDIWNDVEYVLGSSQESSLSTPLFANSNTIKIKACDQLASCSVYQNKINVNSLKRRLEAIDYANMYASATLDQDNIPSEISLIVSSATIDNTLFSQMWNDLQSYASSQSSVSVSLYKSFASAVLALSNQTDSMTAALYKDFMNWLANLVEVNSIPINTDIDSILKIIISFVDGYLDFGRKKADAAMPFEAYLLTADNFLSAGIAYLTVDDLAGQSSLPASDSALSIQYGKIRNFPSSIVKTSQKFGFINTTFPESIPIDNSQVLNFKALTYNITDDYSPWFSVSYATSGSYQDYQYTITSEQYQTFNDDRYSVSISIPYYKNSTKGLSCVYYNTTTSTWEVNGCIITDQGLDTITLSLTHFSLFKIAETEIIPYIPPTNTPECGNNFAPTIILIVSFFIGLFLVAVTAMVEKPYYSKITENDQKVTQIFGMGTRLNESNVKIDEQNKEYVQTFKVDPISDESELFVKMKMSVLQTDEAKNGSENAQIRERNMNENNSIRHEKKDSEFELFHKEYCDERRTKGSFHMLLEGHLAFGLIYYRKDFSRWRRAFLLSAVVIFELLIEGCFFLKFEETDKGREMSVQEIFENYEGNYFGYTILSVLIAAILESVMIACIKNEIRKIVNISMLLIETAILIGSIIGIVLLNIDFCYNWSGYWAESFLWGILMEIFIVQIFYMLFRYAALLIKSKRAVTRTSEEKVIL